ncbi:MAG: glutathione S-transferase N-terminal domain-containing protein [Xanthobacteraceae bacterium]|nr:glutathione S-transferase N-terminal domain-containing protein [Xanthobacteraceae bacterium]
MKVLGRADSLNVRKVLWAMDEMGIEIVREDYGGSFGKTDTEEYRCMNPTGLVPVVIDGDAAIWESNTIIRYLATRSPNKGFAGASSREAAQISQWMDWQLGTLNPLAQSLFVQIRLGEKSDQKIVADVSANLAKLLNTVLKRALPPHGFMFGKSVTAADICLGIMLHRYVSLLDAASLEDRVRQYHKDNSERAGFQKYVAIGKP